MKRITLQLSVLLTGLFIASCESKTPKESESTSSIAATAEAVTYTLITDTSSLVHWKGSMLKMYDHTGTLNFKEGQVELEGGQLKSGTFTIDMTTIKTTDDNYDKKQTREKLIGHLSSEDFFDVANHPTATYTIKSVKGNEAIGTLTIRGNSSDETLKNIVITEEGDLVKGTGTLTFNRKKYDVKFDMPTQNMVVSNDIELKISVTAKK